MNSGCCAMNWPTRSSVASRTEMAGSLSARWTPFFTASICKTAGSEPTEALSALIALDRVEACGSLRALRTLANMLSSRPKMLGLPWSSSRRLADRMPSRVSSGTRRSSPLSACCRRRAASTKANCSRYSFASGTSFFSCASACHSQSSICCADAAAGSATVVCR